MLSKALFFFFWATWDQKAKCLSDLQRGMWSCLRVWTIYVTNGNAITSGIRTVSSTPEGRALTQVHRNKKMMGQFCFYYSP